VGWAKRRGQVIDLDCAYMDCFSISAALPCSFPSLAEVGPSVDYVYNICSPTPITSETTWIIHTPAWLINSFPFPHPTHLREKANRPQPHPSQRPPSFKNAQTSSTIHGTQPSKPPPFLFTPTQLNPKNAFSVPSPLPRPIAQNPPAQNTPPPHPPPSPSFPAPYTLHPSRALVIRGHIHQSWFLRLGGVFPCRELR